METYALDSYEKFPLPLEQTEKKFSINDQPTHDASKYNIIGGSAAIQNALHQISVFGKYDAPVLITGETGTGKELAARGLHYDGIKSAYPFIAVNCATLTDELFASEIYGHKKGAFTDAKQDKKGMLAVAENGTLFLDEIDSLSLKSQASLLRFLQESEYRPVGSVVTHTSNARLIASANCDLEERVEQGLFRRDLYYRLYILTVHMPPLRERGGDVRILIDYFVRKFESQYGLGEKSLSEVCIEVLCRHRWPGNVRELENLIHRLYLSSPNKEINLQQLDAIPSINISALNDVSSTKSHEASATSDAAYLASKTHDVNDAVGDKIEALATETHEEKQEGFDFSRDKKIAVERFEKEYILKLLKLTNGNVTRAGLLCNKERRAFGKLVKKYHLKKNFSWSESVV